MTTTAAPGRLERRLGLGDAVVVGLGAMLGAGISRTALAMARRHELPAALDAVHPRHRAEVAAAAIVCATVADLRDAIGFSSFAVLTYYGLTNATAWTLTQTNATERSGRSPINSH